MSHTPGPWSTEFHEPPIVQHAEDIVAADGTHVVCFGHDYDDYGFIGSHIDYSDKDRGEAMYRGCAANARLIAAAPELLEAAQLLLSNPFHFDENCGPDYDEYCTCRVGPLAAAIAKATGEQP